MANSLFLLVTQYFILGPIFWLSPFCSIMLKYISLFIKWFQASFFFTHLQGCFLLAKFVQQIILDLIAKLCSTYLRCHHSVMVYTFGFAYRFHKHSVWIFRSSRCLLKTLFQVSGRAIFINVALQKMKLYIRYFLGRHPNPQNLSTCTSYWLHFAWECSWSSGKHLRCGFFPKIVNCP